MFLAPINYDRFFKKVFSEPSIAKRFLEDFFDTTINYIEPLKERHKVTDDASSVEVDYRCKIDNRYVIIDMQQWYKKDVTQRFFLYHCLNTVLQLENMPSKTLEFTFPEKKTIVIKDYRVLEPVITLVWLVDDNLDFGIDYISYIMTPEIVSQFIKNKELWYNSELLELLKRREEVISLTYNEEMSFLSKSKLIFMFQKNIVRNARPEKYEKWFRFAMRSRNKDNKKEDFDEFLEDEIFREMIRRLQKESLADDEKQYLENYDKLLKEIERYNQELIKKGEKIGIEKGEKIGIEKGIELTLKLVQLYKEGKTIQEIAKETKLSHQEIELLIDKLK